MKECLVFARTKIFSTKTIRKKEREVEPYIMRVCTHTYTLQLTNTYTHTAHTLSLTWESFSESRAQRELELAFSRFFLVFFAFIRLSLLLFLSHSVLSPVHRLTHARGLKKEYYEPFLRARPAGSPFQAPPPPPPPPPPPRGRNDIARGEKPIISIRC